MDKDTFNSDTGKKISSKKFSLSSLLNEEQNYWMDLNNDGITGNGIVRIYDSNPSGGKGFYKTASNEFIFDQSGMGLGSNTQNPINPTDSRGKKYNFKYEPTGSSSIQVMDENGVFTRMKLIFILVLEKVG